MLFVLSLWFQMQSLMLKLSVNSICMGVQWNSSHMLKLSGNSICMGVQWNSSHMIQSVWELEFISYGQTMESIKFVYIAKLTFSCINGLIPCESKLSFVVYPTGYLFILKNCLKVEFFLLILFFYIQLVSSRRYPWNILSKL